MCFLRRLLSGYLELPSGQIRLSPFPLAKAALLLMPEKKKNDPEMERNTGNSKRNTTFQCRLNWSQGMGHVFKRLLICFLKSHIPWMVNLGWTGSYISTIAHANVQVCSFVLQNIVQCSPLSSLYLAVLAFPPCISPLEMQVVTQSKQNSFYSFHICYVLSGTHLWPWYSS